MARECIGLIRGRGGYAKRLFRTTFMGPFASPDGEGLGMISSRVSAASWGVSILFPAFYRRDFFTIRTSLSCGDIHHGFGADSNRIRRRQPCIPCQRVAAWLRCRSHMPDPAPYLVA